ncbi:MAG: LysM peptidoglycan-binding domain-containing protein [Microbacterium gubbeenense]|uniref:LysM peptidoglycan-binding domain-containing protein n=1 Tax=Microbacterium gubbeenense TaxID=159896 RepID=UPI000414BCE3|nr:LysM peptidoglycan-binding domain-containing protein [Microbacterium gubbeenense]
MSTVTLAAPGPHIATSRTRLRLTTRGRRVLAALAALPVIAGIAIGTFAGGAALGSNDAGAPSGTFQSVTVMPGDSLWGIAERVAPEADPRDVVSEIISLNVLSNSAVDAGDRIAIPAQYSSGL